MAPLVDEFTAALSAALDRPTIIFGHSMGASLAYEVTRRLSRLRPGLVTRLFLSARVALAHQGVAEAPVHLLDDAGLLAEVLRLGGTPSEALAHPELRSLLLPIVRNDFQVVETYQPPLDQPPLDVEIVAFAGATDPRAPVELVRDWASATRRGFRLRVFDGGHFYLVPHRAEVLAEITAYARAGAGQPG